MTAFRLVLFLEGDLVTAVVCSSRWGKTTVEAAESVHVGRVTADSLADGLQRLRGACTARGVGQAWGKHVILCLDAESVLFREWTLPGKSVRMARKSLPLLLDGEFPNETVPLAWRTVFVRESHNLRALCMLLPEETLALWQNALQAQGFESVRVTAQPWPVLAGLPPKCGPALLLHIMRNTVSLAVLDADGRPVRVRTLGESLPFSAAAQKQAAPKRAADWETAFAELHRQASLALEGLSLELEKLLVCGMPPGQDARAALENAFGLPLAAIGRDLPLPGHRAGIAETDTHRLMAALLCQTLGQGGPLSLSPLPGHRKMPVFAVRLQKSAVSGRLEPLLPLAGGVLLLAIGLGSYFWVEAAKISEQEATLRAVMLEELQKAVPGMPKSASASRLRSVLVSNIRKLEEGRVAVPGYGAVQFLESLHALVPQTVRVQVQRLWLDKRQCRLQGTALSYEDVDALRESLDQMEHASDVKVVGATSRGDQRVLSRNAGSSPAETALSRVDFEIVISFEGTK